jgi:flagellar protein FlbD
MIVLHRLGHAAEPFHLNCDLIVTVEACPDTVVTLATGARILVCESPDEIARATLRWKSDIRRGALRPVPRAEVLPAATDHAVS